MKSLLTFALTLALALPALAQTRSVVVLQQGNAAASCHDMLAVNLNYNQRNVVLQVNNGHRNQFAQLLRAQNLHHGRQDVLIQLRSGDFVQLRGADVLALSRGQQVIIRDSNLFRLGSGTTLRLQQNQQRIEIRRGALGGQRDVIIIR